MGRTPRATRRQQRVITNERSPMTLLSNEILLHIFELVRWNDNGNPNRADLKSIRLTCKRLNPVAVSLLFDRMCVSDKAKDLEVLRRRTHLPHLASATEEIIYRISHMVPDLSLPLYTYAFLMYQHRFFHGIDITKIDGLYIRDLLTWRCETMPVYYPCRCDIRRDRIDQEVEYKPGLMVEQKRARKGWPSLWPPEHIGLFRNHPIIRAGHQQYLKEANASVALRSSGEFPRILQAGLRECPNVRKLHLEVDLLAESISAQDLIGQGKDWRKWRGPSRSSPFLRSWCVLYLPPSWLVPSLEHHNTLVSPADRRAYLQPHDISADIEIMSMALHTPGSQLTEFIMISGLDSPKYANSSDPIACVDRMRVVVPPSPQLSTHILGVFISLTTLRLELDEITLKHMNSSAMGMSCSGLLDYLSQMQRLHTSWLCCRRPPLHEFDITPYHFSDLIPIRTRFPALGFLTVKNCVLDPGDLALFLSLNDIKVLVVVLGCVSNYSIDPELAWKTLGKWLRVIPSYRIQLDGYEPWADESPYGPYDDIV
ncbi:hypothetical protein MMC25_008298 [Agyrium rufum]|nr:hypothetical protein [Agyrium rufum]